MKSDAGEIGYYIDLIEISYRCDKTDEINDYVININRLTNATGDCGCSGDEPVLITSITGGLNPTNNIYVYTNSTGGALTTYTEADLIGLTYEVSGSPRRNDFVVYLGGVLDNLTAFDNTTGLLTFSGSLTNGSELTILRIR